MNSCVILALCFTVLLAVAQASPRTKPLAPCRMPSTCTIAQQPYKYCCNPNRRSASKTNLNTAGSARTDAQITKGRSELKHEIDEVLGAVPEDCFPKPSGGFCCTPDINRCPV